MDTNWSKAVIYLPFESMYVQFKFSQDEGKRTTVLKRLPGASRFYCTSGRPSPFY